MYQETLALSRYDTWELDAMVEQIERPNPWLLRTFFPKVIMTEGKTIEFDIVDRGRRMAPFVSPFVAGKPMVLEGYRTASIKPAYIKPTALIVPNEAYTRRPGEGYGGVLTAKQRFDQIVAEHVDLHQQMIDNRLEWMAAQALVLGGITITGEDYPTTYVNFGRDPSLNIALTGAARWNQSTSTPMTDIENAALAVRLISKGAVVTDLVMDGLTWSLLRNHTSIQDQINNFYRRSLPGQMQTSIDAAPRSDLNEAQFVGNLGGRFNLWVYDAYYEDDSATQQPYLPPYTVLGISPGALDGRQYFGAILDLEAGLVSMKSFQKTKLQWNPSALELVTQSAPLAAPKRPNAMFKLTVA